VRAAGELHGPRLLLRLFRLDDVPAVLRYASDREVTRHLEWEAYDDPATAEGFIRSTLVGGTTRIARAVVVRDSDELIGGVELRVVSPSARRAELGYGLARAHWGQGYAQEAARLLIDYGFGPLGLERIQALCAVPNERSVRTLERLGMRCEGRLVHYRGDVDYFLYALTRPVAVP
jgi:ribosomal-protein-alanine N-acetyltransferase